MSAPTPSGFRSPLCRHDAILGLELDDVLLGDHGMSAVPVDSKPHRLYVHIAEGYSARPSDTGWGSWRERELAAYRKRCEGNARRWNAKMRKLREKQERESRESLADSLFRARVPSLSAYVAGSVPDWWAMWSLLWVDVGWCISVIGERGIATNRKELIREGVVTIHFMMEERLPACRTCNSKVPFLLGHSDSDGYEYLRPRYGYLRPRCVMCWVKLPTG